MLFNLEHEKEELLHQMEQASVLSDGSAVGGISQTITRVSSNYIPNEWVTLNKLNIDEPMGQVVLFRVDEGV